MGRIIAAARINTIKLPRIIRVHFNVFFINAFNFLREV
jgi:hypothetical protein